MDEDAGREKPLRETPREAAWEAREASGMRARRAVLDALLTDDEHEAVELAGRVACLLDRIAERGDSRGGDLAELCAAIHTVQNAVLAQAAARAFPDRYRLMGAPAVQAITADTVRRHFEGDVPVRVVGLAGQSVDVVEETMRMTDGGRVSDTIESVTAGGTYVLDPHRELRLPRYRLRTPAPFRWRDVLTTEAAPSDHGVLPYGLCPATGPHEPHRWAVTSADDPRDVPQGDWWLCDPKPGLTGDSHRDLDELAAWSRRHPDAEPAYRAPLEERLAAALAVCATELDETDVANVVAAVLPVVRGA